MARCIAGWPARILVVLIFTGYEAIRPSLGGLLLVPSIQHQPILAIGNASQPLDVPMRALDLLLFWYVIW